MKSFLKRIKENRTLIVTAYCLLVVTVAQSQLNLVSSYQNSSYETAVFATTDYAYISSGQNLEILDLSNIQNPISVGNVVTSGTVNGIYVVGNYAYLASSGLNIVDITDPTAPISVGKLLTGVAAHDVQVVGDYAYIADGDGFKIIDVSDPAAPVLTGSLSYWPAAESVFVSDTIAYVGVLWDGAKVIDISNPALPVQVGSSILNPGGTGGWATDIYESNGKVYMTDGHDGMVIFERNGTNLDSIGAFNIGYASGVYVDSNEVYLADNDFRLLDASDVSNLTSIDLFNSPNGNPGSVHVAGGYIFLGIDYYGLNILKRGNMTTGVTAPISKGLSNSIEVFPNPSNGEFVVELKPADELTLKVSDVQGKVIFETTFNNVDKGELESINISEFANGFYYVQQQDGNGTYTKKIIKH